jgi:hypothetical protein
VVKHAILLTSEEIRINTSQLKTLSFSAEMVMVLFVFWGLIFGARNPDKWGTNECERGREKEEPRI